MIMYWMILSWQLFLIKAKIFSSYMILIPSSYLLQRLSYIECWQQCQVFQKTIRFDEVFSVDGHRFQSAFLTGVHGP